MMQSQCYFVTLIVFLFFTSCEINQQSTEGNIEKPQKVEGIKQKEPKKDKPDLAVELDNLMTHDPKLMRTAPERLLAVRRLLKSGKYNAGQRNEDSWLERGPNNVGGRTRALLIDQGDPSGNTVWAGGVSGGLWQSTNFDSDDVTWQPIDDFFPSIAISTIAQNPSNINEIYFGTGEGWFSSDAVRGQGIWKSSDHGISWEQISSTDNSDFQYVQRIEFDDNGNLFASTRSAGLQRSNDGGNTWQKVLGSGVGGAFSNRIGDIEIAGNSEMYVAVGIRSTDGIYKSKDQGDTWISLNESTLDNGLPKTNYERIELAVAPSNASVIYALFQSEDESDCLGIYRSDDAGENWITLLVPGAFGMDDFTRSQAWYDLTVAVDPVNPYIVYIGGVDLLRSLDGGNTWVQISQWFGGGGFPYVHADQHDIIFYPDNRFKGIVINDGGMSKFEIDPVFEEGNTLNYCAPVHFDCCSDFIENVRLNDIDHNSGAANHPSINGYSDFTSVVGNLAASQQYSLQATPNFTWEDSKFGAWIDFNQNGDFEEDENILSYSGVGPYQAEFDVPSTARHGKTRMRLRLQFSPEYTPHPCDGAYTMGETEDYTISIENCRLNTPCNDDDPCTENDILDANCNCSGTLIDKDGDGNCDLINLPTFQAKVSDYNVTQFYSCAIDPREGSNVMLGGTQDNGTQLFQNEGINSTKEVTGGDGGFCFIDQNEPNIQISSYVYNSYYFTKNNWEAIDFSMDIGESQGRFINPMDYDSETNALFAAYKEGYITRIRNVGTTYDIDTIEIEGLADHTASMFKVDPNIPDAVWIGTPKDFQISSGKNTTKLILLTNASAEVPTVERTILIDDEFAGYAYLTSMDISKLDASRMILTFSNYGVPSVWESNDEGETWQNVEGNLPDMPIRWVIYDPVNVHGAIIATEMGVWRTDFLHGNSTIWETFNEGLANVKCTMLKLREVDNTLVVATYGRGIYSYAYCSERLVSNETICTGTSYDFFGNMLSASGTYEDDISDENSCSGFVTHILNLTVEDTVTVEIDQIICAGDSILFEGIQYSEAGTYSSLITADNSCGFAISKFNLSIQDLPSVYIGDTIFLSIDDDFIIEPDHGFTEYLWNDGSTGSTLMVEGSDLGAGEHFFSLSVKDALGCDAYDELIIIVQNSTGTIDVVDLDVNIYPNPASQILHLDLGRQEDAIISIFSLSGEKLSQVELKGQDIKQLNVSSLTAGIYMINVTQGTKVSRQKFIKI